MSSLLQVTWQFLDARRETISTLKLINEEINLVGKKFSAAKLVTKITAAGSKVKSGDLVEATKLTAKIPIAAGKTLASGASEMVSAGKAFVKSSKEKGLVDKMKLAIDKDRAAKERLKSAAKAVQALASISMDGMQFLSKAAEIGFITMEELDAIITLDENSKAVETAKMVAKVIVKVNKVAKIVGPFIIGTSLPFDIIDVLAELIDRDKGDVSNANIRIQNSEDDLQNEYANVNQAYIFMRRELQ